MGKWVAIGVGVVAAVAVLGVGGWLLLRDDGPEGPNRSGLDADAVVSVMDFVFQDDEGKYLCPPEDLYEPSRIDPTAGSPRCDAPRDEVIPLRGLELKLPPPNDEDIRVAYVLMTVETSEDGNEATVIQARFAPERQP